MISKTNVNNLATTKQTIIEIIHNPPILIFLPASNMRPENVQIKNNTVTLTIPLPNLPK